MQVRAENGHKYLFRTNYLDPRDFAFIGGLPQGPAACTAGVETVFPPLDALAFTKNKKKEHGLRSATRRLPQYLSNDTGMSLSTSTDQLHLFTYRNET